MFTRPFRPDLFLRTVFGTEPFIEYCRQRQIPFEQTPSAPLTTEDVRRWTVALAQLPHERHAAVELELATVNELAGRNGSAHLLETALPGQLPPESIPRGAPLALWYFVHEPHRFHEVFFAHEVEEDGVWRTGQAAAGLSVIDPKERAKELREALRTFFQAQEGSGRFCTADGLRLKDSVCFVAQVADRLQFFDTFTDSGTPTLQRLRRALPVLFVYRPADGAIFLKTHLRSAERTAQLFQLFGAAVLGEPVRAIHAAFDLDRLKAPFAPLPDSPDMELIRVKTLHLRYPRSRGRRQLKLETRTGDDPAAIEELLRLHVGDRSLDRLEVCHAKLQVRLRIDGRARNYLIHLWPNRSSIGQTPLGDRFRSCLRRWGLTHGR